MRCRLALCLIEVPLLPSSLLASCRGITSPPANRSILLLSVGFEEWAVRVIQGMCTNSRCHVWVSGEYSEEFGVWMGMHQGSVLSPLLFTLVLETPLHELCTGGPWELLYADELVLIADTLEVCMFKLKAWKTGVESKDFHANIKRTKFLVFGIGLDVLKNHRTLTVKVVGPQKVQRHNWSIGFQPKFGLPLMSLQNSAQ